MSKPILYSYWRSSCSWRVRTALALKNIEYEYCAIHLVNKDQCSTDHAVLNPMKQVPALVINGHTLSQSLAIIEYLDEVYPDGPKLLPTSPVDRAKVRMLSEVINSGTQPIQNLSVLNYVAERGVDKAEFGKHFIRAGLVAYEQMLQETAGKYSYKDEITMADLCLVPQVFNANRFSVDMSEFPTINRILDELNKHPAFIAAHPSKQPDAVA